MADLKISELSALAGADLATGDLAAVVDTSASETKRITVGELISNGIGVVADDSIPGAKILFGTGEIPGSALENGAINTAQIADDAVTAAKIADEATVDLVTALPASGGFIGQVALDTADGNKIYVWNGSSWLSVKGAGSVNTIVGSTAGIINIAISVTGDQVSITPSFDNTTGGGQFLAGPTGAAGAVSYRTITGTDIPVATTGTRGGVAVNGNGLVMSGDEIRVDNTVVANTTQYHVAQYDANGLITAGRQITAADLPEAGVATKGAVYPGTGLEVTAGGELNHTNSATPGTYTKVTVDSQGHVSSGTTLASTDIPALDADKTTTGTFPTARIANAAITADKLADQSICKFGGAGATDNVVVFPEGDFKGQFFFDESKDGDLYIYTGQSFQPITVISGNLVNAGTYDASVNQMTTVTTAGSAVGFTQGSALPQPTDGNLNYYVVVDTSGTGTGYAPAVSLAPPDMLVSLGAGQATFSLIDVSNAIAGQTAANISFVPSGNLSSTDVQAALQEVDSEKAGLANPTFTGNVTISTAGTLVFEGATANDFETTLTVTDPTSDRTITLPNVDGTVITTGDTGTVTSTMILDGTIVNADISTTAEIAVSKLADGAARQLLQTNVAGTGVEWASNIDIPGTLDVTGVATFDSTASFSGNVTFNGNVVFEGSTADANETTLTVVDPTADRTITLPDATTTVAGLAVTQSFSKAQRGSVVALTDGATITPDFAESNNFSVTLGGNRTLANPSNQTAGQSGTIVVTQDATGSRTLAFGSNWKFPGGTAPTLTTTGSSVDVIAYYVESASRITAQVLLNVS